VGVMMINIQINCIIDKYPKTKKCPDLKTLLFCRKKLCQLKKNSQKLIRQCEKSKQTSTYEFETFKLNDSIALVLKDLEKFGLVDGSEISAVMSSKVPVSVNTY
jgi:hypothetical protein